MPRTRPCFNDRIAFLQRHPEGTPSGADDWGTTPGQPVDRR